MWNNQGGGYEQQQGFGDQGGGYLNSATVMGSPAGSQDRRNRQRAQNIMPVTFAQVIHCDQVDEKFVIDNIELHQVTVVGLVRDVKETQTRLDYIIDDMSGAPLEVKQFVDNAEDTAAEDRTMPMRENTYVRIFGHVRSFNNKRSIVAFKIMPVTDMNELTSHLLETVYTHLYMKKSGGGGDYAGAVGGDSTAATSAPSMDYSGAQADQGLTPVQQQVYNVIRSCQDEQGVSTTFISERVKGPPPKAIRDAIEFLSGEGHIYSTIDDEHFKSTDGM